MLRRHVVALVRCLALAALAVASLLSFVVNVLTAVTVVVGLFPLHSAAIDGSRKLANLCRRLAGDWGGVPIPVPYRPGPPIPSRRPDGWYAYGNRLYKSPRIPAALERNRWIGQDPASALDFAWMFANPLVGGALAVLAPALVIGGAAAVAAPLVWPAVPGTALAAVPLGVAAVLAGLAAAPRTVRLHARWTGVLLRPAAGPPIPRRLGRRVSVVWHCLALAGLSAAGLVVFVLQVLAYLAVWGPGQQQIVVFSRGLTNTYRRLARDWAGVEIPEPYLPEPAPPEPGPDGRYRYRRTLHANRLPVERAQRIEWVLRDRATWHDLAWMLTAAVAAVPLLALVAVVGYGFFGLIWQPLWWPLWALPLWQLADVWFSPWRAWGPIVALAPALDVVPGPVSPLIGAAATVLGLLVAPALVRMHARWSRLLLGPTEHARLAQRVHRLTETRANATEVQAAELRRIERDLHDGAQARLVAMGMTLGAIEQLVETDPAAAKALLAKARESSAQALNELRELVRGIHPPVLAERGLADAVRALALDTPLAVEVDADLPGRPEPPVESAAYFAVAEALANAARHSGARRVWIDIGYADGMLRATVTDDGCGGAIMTPGGGLAGIERRLGTFDGVVALSSPPGGPTTVTMEIPCALSSPRTNCGMS